MKSRPDSVGAGGGGKGLSLHSHFTQKTSEMSRNESVGFENRGSVMDAPQSLVHPNCSAAERWGVLQKEMLLSDKCQRNFKKRHKQYWLKLSFLEENL